MSKALSKCMVEIFLKSWLTVNVFFDNDPKVALKNLPVDLIDKIQVHSRETDQARMSGFSDGEDETVINLSIKPGRKKVFLGTALAGLGSRERYEVNAILNRFADTKQWTLLSGLNNTNNAGFSELNPETESNQKSRGRSRGQSNMPMNKGITISRMLATNLALKLTTESDIGNNTSIGNSDKLQATKSETIYAQTNGNTIENSQDDERVKAWSATSNLRLDWKPRKDTELVFEPRLSYGNSRNLNHKINLIVSERSEDEISRGEMTELSNRKTFSIGANLDFSHRLGTSGRMLALGVDASWSSTAFKSEYYNDMYIVEASQRT